MWVEGENEAGGENTRLGLGFGTGQFQNLSIPLMGIRRQGLHSQRGRQGKCRAGFQDQESGCLLRLDLWRNDLDSNCSRPALFSVVRSAKLSVASPYRW